MKRPLTDLTGRKFDRWEVLEFAYAIIRGKTKPRLRRYWLCQCTCGNKIPVLQDSLLRGTTGGCTQCADFNRQQGYTELISQTLWSRILNGAKQRNKPVTISKEDATNTFLLQEGRCALSGIIITLAKNSYEQNRGQYTASLDRIDNSKGYIKGNVQWVHKDINRMKNIHSQEYFIGLCKKVAEYHH